MVRHTESLIYTKCPKTLGDKKESTVSSVSQPPRSDRDPTRSIRPLERDDRERAREHGAKTAHASSARKNNPRASRVHRSPASSRRRRAAVRQSHTRPAKPRASSEGFKNSVSFHESPPVKPDTHSRFRLPGERPRARRGANVADDGRRRDGGFPPIERGQTGARVVAVHRASVPLLLSLLGGRLDGDRRGSLDVRGRDDKHSICFFRARVCRRATRLSSRDRDRETERPITDDGTTSGDSSFHGGLRSTVCSIEFTCHLVRLCMSVNDRVYLCFILLWISIRHQIWYGMVCGSDTNGRFASFGDGFQLERTHRRTADGPTEDGATATTATRGGRVFSSTTTSTSW